MPAETTDIRTQLASLTIRVHPCEHVVSAVQDEDAVLLDLRTERFFSLDHVGTEIWTALSDGLAIPEILTTLQRAYHVDPATLEKDVLDLLTELYHAGLITVQ